MLARSNAVADTLRDSSRALLDDFLSAKSTQSFSIDANRMTTLVSQASTRFTFYPGGFQRLTGAEVTGEVQVQIKEVFRKSDMILTDLMTTSEDRLLESAGHFHIQASQEGIPLQLAIPIAVEMPLSAQVANPLATRLFTGLFSNMFNATSNKLFDWRLLVNKSLKVRKIAGKKYYHFYITDLKWFSCSHLHTRRALRTMVSARCVSAIEDFEEQAAFIVFKNINSVARMYPNINRFTALHIPVNQAATIILIGFRQGEWFYGAHSMEKTSSQLVSVKVEPVIESQLIEYLRRL